MSNPKEITITISETVRYQPYENIKPEVTATWDVPADVDLDEFYLEKYQDLKKIYNRHLYLLLYHVQKRLKGFNGNPFKHVKGLLKGNETFPHFRPTTKITEKE